MVVTLDRMVIANQVSQLHSSTKLETIYRAYITRGITVKNVPYVRNKYNKQEPYLLSGKTLIRVYQLIHQYEQGLTDASGLYYT